MGRLTFYNVYPDNNPTDFRMSNGYVSPIDRDGPFFSLQEALKNFHNVHKYCEGVDAKGVQRAKYTSGVVNK